MAPPIAFSSSFAAADGASRLRQVPAVERVAERKTPPETERPWKRSTAASADEVEPEIAQPEVSGHDRRGRNRDSAGRPA